MDFQMPSGILENTGAALALLAAIICIAGMLVCACGYIAFFLAVQNADTAISPQFDSAATMVSDAQATLLIASNSTQAIFSALPQAPGSNLSSSAADLSSSLGKAAGDMGQAGQSLSSAKTGFKGALGMVNIALFLVCLALEAFFSATLLSSISILLGHYPRMFGKKQEKPLAAKAEEKHSQAKRE